MTTAALGRDVTTAALGIDVTVVLMSPEIVLNVFILETQESK